MKPCGFQMVVCKEENYKTTEGKDQKENPPGSHIWNHRWDVFVSVWEFMRERSAIGWAEIICCSCHVVVIWVKANNSAHDKENEKSCQILWNSWDRVVFHMFKKKKKTFMPFKKS